jgi:hypothetical protein
VSQAAGFNAPYNRESSVSAADIRTMTDTSIPREPAELRIQIHPDVVSGLDLVLLRQVFDHIGKTEQTVIRSRWEEGDDNGQYVNLAFKTSDRAGLWAVVEAELFGHPVLGELLGKSSMALCTGDDGWDDYLLLFHFNPEFEIDEIDQP